MNINKIFMFMFLILGLSVSVNAVIDYSTDVDFATFIDWTTSTTATNDMINDLDLVTNVGATTIDTANQYIDFDGTTNRLDFPAVNFTAPYTYSMLVNVDVKVSDATFMAKYFSDDDRLFTISSNTEWDIRTITEVATAFTDQKCLTDLNASTWYLVTISDDGAGNLKQYYNTVECPSVNIGRGSHINTAALVFGGNKFIGGRFLDGKESQFYLFNKVLTPTELTQHYNNVYSNRAFNPYGSNPSLNFVNITANNVTLLNNTFYNSSIDFETNVLNLSTNGNVNQSYHMPIFRNQTQLTTSTANRLINVNSLDTYCSQQGLGTANNFVSQPSTTTAYWTGSIWVDLGSSSGSELFGCSGSTTQYATNNLNGSFSLNLTDGNYQITFCAENNETDICSDDFDFTVDKINPTITNNIPSEINSYDFGGSLFSCGDTNLLSCNISIDGFNKANNINFTLLTNGNLTYNITATDLSGNSLIESGLVLINPIQLFNFELSNGTNISNFTLGGLDFVNQANITTYNSIIFLGNNTLLFEKLGFSSTNVTFNLNITSIINLTTNITQSQINVRIFNRETNTILTGLTSITLQATIGFTGSTTTGLLNISNINFLSEQYQVLASREGYTTESVFFNYNNQETINVNIFMLNKTSANYGDIKLIVKNSLSQFVESAVCSALEWRPSESAFVTVAQGLSNVNGEILLNIQLNTKIYKFSCTKDTFTTITNAQIIQLDDSSLTIILDDLLLEPVSLFPNLVTSLTNTTLNTSHQLITYNFADSDGLTTQACINVYLVNGNRQTFQTQTCVSTSTGTILLAVNTNQTSNVLIQGGLTTSEINNFITNSLTFQGVGNIAQQFKIIGLDVLIPTILLLLGLGLGILLKKIEIAVIFMLIAGWVSVGFVPTIMKSSIAMFISVIVALMLWGGFNRK